ncbi:hypothetical protein L548_0203 [Bordetella pertussis H921]|nr:hypothetical protein L548_0203 [Bordetella pertussis H921]
MRGRLGLRLRAIDDHARVAFTDIHPDERFPSAVQFLKDAGPTTSAWA